VSGHAAIAALVGAAVLALMLAADEVAADGGPDGNCRDPAFHWSETQPPINLRHIFCGEIDGGRPKGLHSARLLETSPVALAVRRRQEEGAGVYSAVVRFAGGKEKLSTFFPDACTVEDVARSVTFAARHVSGRNPAWGELGPSAPAAGAPGYCLDARGEPLTIRFGRLRDGRINTAFPDRGGR
jgi:hypothetical protein